MRDRSLMFFRQSQKIDPVKDKDLKFINQIITIKPEFTVVMPYGNPYLVESLKNTAAFLTGYGADSFIKSLKGELSPQEKLPVVVSQDFPIGSGMVDFE